MQISCSHRDIDLKAGRVGSEGLKTWTSFGKGSVAAAPEAGSTHMLLSDGALVPGTAPGMRKAGEVTTPNTDRSHQHCKQCSR